jgi:hypothetical protein
VATAVDHVAGTVGCGAQPFPDPERGVDREGGAHASRR